jgi:MFS family permease
MRREWFWVPATAYLHGLFIIVLLTWMNPMTQAKFGVNDMQGSLAVGLVSLGIGAGRLFLWKVPVPLDDRIILSGSGLVGAGLLTITFLAPSYWVTILMLVVAGFICSATFPCILSLVGNRFPATKSRMYGYMDAAVAAAGLTGPPLVGLLGDSGLLLHHAVFVSPVAGVVLAAVSMGWLGATRQADADDRSRCTP